MICKFCRERILEANETWGEHHDNLESFARSVKQQCIFCLVLSEDLISLESWFNGASPKALFRWNLRRAVKTRESEEFVIITFRALRGRSTEKVQDEHGKLPDRVFYLLPEEDSGTTTSFTQLGMTTNSTHARERINEWVKNCERNHPKCNRAQSSHDFIPTRLLDLGHPRAKWPPESLRVVDTKRNAIHSTYVTLSHCWGKKFFRTLRKEDIQESGNATIPWKEISENRNFVDAIEVARHLRVRYIWIDSLCIIQNDGSVDFGKEGPKMHQVYRNSACNIAAADSEDCEGGLFRIRDPKAESIISASYKPRQMSKVFGDRAWRIFPRDMFEKDLLTRVLYSRAWVFQERMLSPRLLHFSRDQIFWDCATTTACETLLSGLPRPLDLRAATDRHWRERLQESTLLVQPLAGSANDSLESFWKTAVRTYSRCDLTNQTDKLMAIWGIATLVRDALKEDFGAGLWDKNLHEQLAWRVVDPGKAERPAALRSGFPSWSWASVVGEVEVADRIAGGRFHKVTDHEGKEISFQLEENRFHRQDEDTAATWAEEMPRMNEQIARMRAKALEIIEEEKSAEWAGKPAESLIEEEEERKAGFDGSNAKEAENLPILRSKSIPIRGHVFNGTLTSNDNGKWGLLIDGTTEVEGFIDVFPDVLPEGNKLERKFIILAASREFLDEFGRIWSLDEDAVEDEDLEQCYYSGAGIVLERCSDRFHFRRIGAMSFGQVSHTFWSALLKTCCDTNTDEGHNLEDGVKIWLD